LALIVRKVHSLHPVLFSFLLVQKRNKKRPPKTVTPRFRMGISIKLLYYCGEGQWSFDGLLTELLLLAIELYLFMLMNKRAKFIKVQMLKPQ
jgi:hypothetical protein